MEPFRTDAERLASIETIVTRIEANQTREVEGLKKRVRRLELGWATATGAVGVCWLWLRSHISGSAR